MPAVRDYAKTLPYVEYVADNLYSCSQDTQDKMTQVIRANNLNRIVVAACTPKTHEPLFQETLVNAGLNKYLFEMTNIRNQDSWVHKESARAGHGEGQGPGADGRGQGGPSGALPETDLEVKPERPGAGRRHCRHDGGQDPAGTGLPRDPGRKGPSAGRAGPEPLPDLAGRGYPGAAAYPCRFGEGRIQRTSRSASGSS